MEQSGMHTYILVVVAGLALMIALIFVVTRTIFFVARFGFGKGILMSVRAKPVSWFIVVSFVVLKFTWPEVFVYLNHF